jgi:hypothetical protein
MDLSIEPNENQPRAGRQAGGGLLLHLYDDDPEHARIPAAQQMLFPASPHELCAELGLNWWAVLKLFQDGWLSFSPEHTPKLDEEQEAELRFIGSLVAGGCDRAMLKTLLEPLRRPYAYDLHRLYFDWMSRHWRVLPDPRAHPEAAFADWLELLVQAGDRNSLSGISELAQDAMSRVN